MILILLLAYVKVCISLLDLHGLDDEWIVVFNTFDMASQHVVRE
jgi:hypothetical protein